MLYFLHVDFFRILEQSSKNPYFWIDDVWVTGYLTQKAGILHIDIKRFKVKQSNPHIIYKILKF